jgi:hypothetical protein
MPNSPKALKETRMSTVPVQTVRSTSKAKLALFWLYVTLPLAWGVVNTLSQAVKLFR